VNEVNGGGLEALGHASAHGRVEEVEEGFEELGDVSTHEDLAKVLVQLIVNFAHSAEPIENQHMRIA